MFGIRWLRMSILFRRCSMCCPTCMSNTNLLFFSKFEINGKNFKILTTWTTLLNNWNLLVFRHFHRLFFDYQWLFAIHQCFLSLSQSTTGSHWKLTSKKLEKNPNCRKMIKQVIFLKFCLLENHHHCWHKHQQNHNHDILQEIEINLFLNNKKFWKCEKLKF